MKRADAIAALVFAGYHEDSARWTRLYIENRVSYAVAQDAWNRGRRMKTNGMRCNCGECKETKG